jgi:guanine deaminase
MDARQLMEMAIAKAREGVAAGQSPFGCAIVYEGEIVACDHNQVLATTDITAHAEIMALRTACREVGEILLPGAVAATTCEPCPMCTAALHWARVDVVYCGATIADASRGGFNELLLPAADVLRIGGSTVRLVHGILIEECRRLFDEWNARPGRKAY